MQRHYRRRAEEPAEIYRVADGLALCRDDAHGGGLVVDHADSCLIGNDSGDGIGARVAGDGDHVEPDRADAGHCFELIDAEHTVLHGGDHARVLGHGDKCAGQAADMARGHDAAFFDSVVEEREGSGRAVRAAFFKTHYLQYLRNAVAYRGSGSKGEVDHAEGHTETARGLLRNKLAHARYLEGGLFYRLRHDVKALALALLECVGDDAGAGHTDVYDRLRFADTVERPRHKGVILNCVRKYDELCAAHRVNVRGLLYYPAHERDGVHVYARSRRGKVHARTDKLRLRERGGDGVDKTQVAFRKALVRKRREAADEVHARLVRGAVERQGNGGIILLPARSSDERYRAYRDALIDNGYAQLPLDGAAGFDKLTRAAAYLVVDLPAALVHALARAVKQAYAHGDRAHIEVLLVYHVYCLQNFTAVEEIAHGAPQILCMASKMSCRWIWISSARSSPFSLRKRISSSKGRVQSARSTSIIIAKYSCIRV